MLHRTIDFNLTMAVPAVFLVAGTPAGTQKALNPDSRTLGADSDTARQKFGVTKPLEQRQNRRKDTDVGDFLFSLPAPMPDVPEDRSLLAMPLRDWAWSDLDSFLQLRVRENEAIEYKASFDSTLPDTMVAMANGDGGHIFVGVSEKGNKIPDTWPLLDGPKDRSESAYSHAAANTVPIVQIEARALFGPDNKQVVAIWVPPGVYPPYFAREKGVRVRVGDGDVLADLRTLEALFQRREEPESVRGRHRQRLFGPDLPQPDPAKPLAPQFAVLVSPLYSSSGIPLNETTSRIVRNEAVRSLARLGFDLREFRSDRSLAFRTKDDDLVRVLANGDIRYDFTMFEADMHTPASDIDLGPLAGLVYDFLVFAEAALAGSTAYRSALYVGFGGKNLADRRFHWPGIQVAAAVAEPFDSWVFDTQFGVGADPLLPMRQIMVGFGWRLGLDGVEQAVLEWGRELERGRHPP